MVGETLAAVAERLVALSSATAAALPFITAPFTTIPSREASVEIMAATPAARFFLAMAPLQLSIPLSAATKALAQAEVWLFTQTKGLELPPSRFRTRLSRTTVQTNAS